MPIGPAPTVFVNAASLLPVIVERITDSDLSPASPSAFSLYSVSAAPFVGTANIAKLAAQEAVASSGAPLTTLANITSSLLKLPPSLQTYVDNIVDLGSGTSTYLQSTTGLSSTTIYSTAAAVVLLSAVPVVLGKRSHKSAGKSADRPSAGMSNRFGWSARGGLSPFSSNLGTTGGGVPAITDDDFSYITSEDLESHGLDKPRRPQQKNAPDASSSHSYGRSAPQVPEDDDILLIKNKGVTYPEHFPAYSIGDGQVLVRDLLERVQLVMKISPRRARRVRLLYKGRQLKDMDKPIRDYGVKNNSEVLVVLGDATAEDSSDESSEEVVVVDGDAGATRKKPNKKKRRGKKRDAAARSSAADSNSNTGLEVPFDSDRRGGSSSRPESPSALSGVSGASAAASVPGGPMAKLNSIGMHFTTKLLPLCSHFIANPPADPKKRVDEHRRISETVMQQVILKLDEVDTQGEDEARARRKELVRHVQSVLKEMDARLQG